MSSFRKILTVIFFFASLVGVGVLAGAWFGIEPIASFVDANGGQAWFGVTLTVLLAIFALGLFIVLLRALFARSKSAYQESSNDYGSVYISKTTIAQAVEDAVSHHPELRYLKCVVRIVNRKHPYVDITARVAPRGLVSLATIAPILQKEIKDAVEAFTGNEVRSVAVDIRENHDPDDVMSADEAAEASEIAPVNETAEQDGYSDALQDAVDEKEPTEVVAPVEDEAASTASADADTKE
jgi:hypothetical protein